MAIQTTIDLSPQLNERILEAARLNGESRSRQIIRDLEEIYGLVPVELPTSHKSKKPPEGLTVFLALDSDLERRIARRARQKFRSRNYQILADLSKRYGVTNGTEEEEEHHATVVNG